MRNFEERKAEVFRRSEERIHTRRKQRNCILAFCIPLCLILTVWSAGLLPFNLAPATNGGSDYPGDLVGSAGSNVATNDGQTNPNTPGNNCGNNDGLTGEVPLLTLETYDEYLNFIGSAELPAEFVLYEDISHLGEFRSFVCLSEVRVNDFSSCMYTLIDESQSQFMLYVDIGSQETVPPVSTVTAVNKSNMRSLVNSTDSGSFIMSGMEYKYVGGKLLSIAWFKDNVRYTLSGDSMLGDYPENATTTVVAKLMNIETAASCLDTLLYEPADDAS